MNIEKRIQEIVEGTFLRFVAESNRPGDAEYSIEVQPIRLDETEKDSIRKYMARVPKVQVEFLNYHFYPENVYHLRVFTSEPLEIAVKYLKTSMENLKKALGEKFFLYPAGE